MNKMFRDLMVSFVIAFLFLLFSVPTQSSVKEGDVVGPGTIIAETQETASILHKSMVPPSITEGTVIKAAPDGDYTILEPIVTIQLNDGTT